MTLQRKVVQILDALAAMATGVGIQQAGFLSGRPVLLVLLVLILIL